MIIVDFIFILEYNHIYKGKKMILRCSHKHRRQDSRASLELESWMVIMKIPVMIQMQNGENGVAALGTMLGYYKCFVPIEELREVCVVSRNGSSPADIAKAAGHYGLDATVKRMTAEELPNQEFPLMIQWKRRYYALIKSVRGNIVTVADPARGIYKLEMNKLKELFTGTVIFFEKNSSFQAGGRRESLLSLVGKRIQPLIRTLILLSFFTIACVLLNLAMVRQQKEVLDGPMGNADPAKRAAGLGIIALYVLLMIIYVAASISKTWLLSRTSRRVSAKSGSGLFKKIFHLPLSFFEIISGWEVISRIENNIKLDYSIMNSLVPRVIDVVMCLIYIGILFFYNYFIAGVCLAIVLVSFMISLAIQDQSAIAARSMTTFSNSVNASLLNGMNMIDTIQSTGAERDFYNIWYDSQVKYNESRKTQILFSAFSTLNTNLSGNILQAVQLFMGAYFVVHGSFTLGSMALFQGVLGSMITSVNNCISTLDMLQTMRTNIERVNDINKRESKAVIPLRDEDKANALKLSGRLSAKNLCYRYNKGDERAIDNVSIEVNPGEMVAIVGATGCGKSTLLKVLAGLYDAESGEILYDGKQRSEIPDVIFHSSVSTVDQESVMFEDSIYNNIRMWDSTIENIEIVLAARDAQIHGRISREPKGYGAVIKENGRNFSGGELQRLELARALAHEPTLLLLDEFTSALDALTEDRAMKALKDKGTTCVIVAHRLSTIVDCDRIYVMDHGRIVQTGTHKELYNQEGLYKTLIG